MTDVVKRFERVAGVAPSERILETSGGIVLVARLSDTFRPRAIAFEHRHAFAALGCSVFAGPSAPVRSMKLADVRERIARLASGEQIEVFPNVCENWREIWVVPNIVMPDALKLMAQFGFPCCLREDLESPVEDVRDNAVRLAMTVHQKHPLHVIALGPAIVEFAYIEHDVPRSFRSATAKQIMQFNRENFPCGPYRKLVEKAWVDQGVFELGPT